MSKRKSSSRVCLVPSSCPRRSEVVVPAFDIRQHVNPETKKLIDDAIEILDRRKAGSLTKRGASNKIKEDIGEYRAMQRISNRFPSARSILVATRPNSVPIVDLLFETPDGRFIIVEAKFSSSGSVHFGRTNTSLWEFTPDGWHEVVPPPKTTVQMSPQWINNRVLELERSGKPGARRLAARLKQALFAGQVEAYTVPTDRTGEVLRTLDHTPELVSAFRRPGVQFRPQSTVAASVVGERGVGATERAVRDRGPGVGERSIEGRTAAAEAMDGPIGHRVDPGVEAAVRESAEVAASEGAEVAIREGGTIAARKGVVGRSARTV